MRKTMIVEISYEDTNKAYYTKWLKQRLEDLRNGVNNTFPQINIAIRVRSATDHDGLKLGPIDSFSYGGVVSTKARIKKLEERAKLHLKYPSGKA